MSKQLLIIGTVVAVAAGIAAVSARGAAGSEDGVIRIGA
jgi:hypothetical protein